MVFLFASLSLSRQLPGCWRMLARSLMLPEKKPPTSDQTTDTTSRWRFVSLWDLRFFNVVRTRSNVLQSSGTDRKCLCDAKLTVFPVVAAPVRQSGHVRPRLHTVQCRAAVWLQVSPVSGTQSVLRSGTAQATLKHSVNITWQELREKVFEVSTDRKKWWWVSLRFSSPYHLLPLSLCFPSGCSASGSLTK